MENLNTFKSNGGRLVIERLPELEFFSKSFVLPSVSIPAIQRSNQIARIPEQGDSMIQSPLEITFVLDEEARNYEEIYNWLQGYSTPTQLIDYSKSALTQSTGQLRSDMTFTLMSLKNNQKLEFTFKNAFPTDLSSININAVEESTVELTCSVTFEYDKPFTITRI